MNRTPFRFDRIFTHQFQRLNHELLFALYRQDGKHWRMRIVQRPRDLKLDEDLWSIASDHASPVSDFNTGDMVKVDPAKLCPWGEPAEPAPFGVEGDVFFILRFFWLNNDLQKEEDLRSETFAALSTLNKSIDPPWLEICRRQEVEANPTLLLYPLSSLVRC